jgi:hypothetical protein
MYGTQPRQVIRGGKLVEILEAGKRVGESGRSAECG